MLKKVGLIALIVAVIFASYFILAQKQASEDEGAAPGRVQEEEILDETLEEMPSVEDEHVGEEVQEEIEDEQKVDEDA